MRCAFHRAAAPASSRSVIRVIRAGGGWGRGSGKWRAAAAGAWDRRQGGGGARGQGQQGRGGPGTTGLRGQLGTGTGLWAGAPAHLMILWWRTRHQAPAPGRQQAKEAGRHAGRHRHRCSRCRCIRCRADLRCTGCTACQPVMGRGGRWPGWVGKERQVALRAQQTPDGLGVVVAAGCTVYITHHISPHITYHIIIGVRV